MYVIKNVALFNFKQRWKLWKKCGLQGGQRPEVPPKVLPPPHPPTHKHTHKDLGPLGSPLKLKPRLLIDTWVRNLILTP